MCCFPILTCLHTTTFRVCSIDLIPEYEYERLLLKITPTRIMMPSEYKGQFQDRFRSKCYRYTFLNLPPAKDNSGGYSVYSYSGIGSIERALIFFSVFSLVETISFKIWERPLSWRVKCSLPWLKNVAYLSSLMLQQKGELLGPSFRVLK